MLRARLFGGLAVEIDGRELPPIPGLKPRALLAYLLLHPRRHARERLAGRFWPDVLDTSARASLRNSLSVVRSALDAVGGGAYLESDRTSVGLALGLPREVDTEELDELVRAGDRASLERAVALATGPLLADLSDDWVLEAQEEYRRRVVDALEQLAAEAERAGDPGRAVELTRRIVELDRLSEGAHRALMRRLARSGDRAQALAAYRRFKAALAAELGVVPSAETRALAEGLRDDGATALAPPPAPAVPRRAEAAMPPMVAREAELRALTDALDDATGGRGGVALVSGEAGIGKSRLASELGARAQAGGARLATGAALELRDGSPFGPWLELLRDLVDLAPAPPAAAAWPADLARLCPSAEARWGRSPPAATVPELERARLFEAVVEMTAWCAAAGPLLMVLEDLHWADPASVALLAHLGRRLTALPALAVVTRREAYANPELDLALDALDRRGALAARVRLGPMDEGALALVARSAAPGLAPEAAARAAAAADGNPLLATTAARALALGDDPSRGLTGRVRGPLGRLSPPGRLLVDLASAAERPLELGEAARLVGPEALPEAFAEGLAAELLDPSDARRIRFVHDLLREACYAELSAARRAWAHERLARALADSPTRSPAEVARHLRLSGDDAAARPYLVTAASEARAVGALDESVAFLREAADLAADDPLAEAELRLSLGDAEAWRGDRAAMDDAFERALALLDDAGPSALAEAYVSRGRWLRGTLCYPREALSSYRTALSIIDEASLEAPELRAIALAGAAWAEALAGDPAAAQGLVAAAEATPEATTDPLLAAELALAQAAALMRTGRFEEAEEPSQRAAALAEARGRPDLAYGAWDAIASAAASRGDFARALTLATRALDGRGASLSLQADVHAARAYALSRLGRHAEAEAAAREEAELAARVGVVEHEATADFDLGSILLASGDPSRAAERLRAALSVPTRKFSRPLARLRLAEALLACGEGESAAEELGRVPFEPIGAADLPDTLVARMARIQGLVAAAAGDDALALRRLAEAEAGWRRRLEPEAAGDAFAANLTDLGRPPVAGLVEPGVELGRVFADRAVLLASLGRADESRQAIAAALDLADRLGFDGYREALAALGAAEPSPRKGSARGPA